MPTGRAHAKLNLTVDLAILTVREGTLQVLLIERGNQPYQGNLALPGGFLRPNEDVEAAARRELKEETAIGEKSLPLTQLPVFADPDRDPRGRVVTVPYLAIAPNLPVPTAGSDAAAAQWYPIDEVLKRHLAFDHDDILRAAVEEARRKLEYTTLAPAFCAETFTIGELRGIYEVVWGQPIDARNFNRKVTKTKGFLEPCGERRTNEPGRPAVLYKRGTAEFLHPPMLRSGD
jgi:8-oxo-dGTP diphosphatase